MPTDGANHTQELALDHPSILIDGTQLLQKRGTGIASYTRTLAKCLHSLGARVSLLFGTDSRPRRGDPAYALATQVFSHRPPLRRLTRIASLALRSRLGLKRSVEAFEVAISEVDLTFLDPPLPLFDRLFNAESIHDRATAASLWGTPMATMVAPEAFAAIHWTGPVPLKSSTGPNLYTIHDLVPIQFPYFVIDRPGNSARVHDAIAKVADGIITVSETSKSKILDILRIPPERVTVTYQPAPTPSPLSQEDAEWIVSTIYDVMPKSYAVYLGAIEPKKNVRRLMEAFMLARLSIPLLLAGPKGWLHEEEEELLAFIEQRFGGGVLENGRSSRGSPESNALANRVGQLPVRYLGYLPRRHVTALLQCAKFLVFPSIYEGFGLPPLEAMQLGVPVLTSRTASLIEVVGDAALLVDPQDVDDIARGIREMDADSDLRVELTRRGSAQATKFSEHAYIQRLREAYAKVGVLFPSEEAETKVRSSTLVSN